MLHCCTGWRVLHLVEESSSNLWQTCDLTMCTSGMATTPDVIRDLNLEIFDHEFLVLVGPSGCGKSTALRMIAGLEEITEGDLYIGGSRVNDVAPKDRDIAMVFQNYALYPHMNVYDNMAFSLTLRQHAESRDRAPA